MMPVKFQKEIGVEGRAGERGWALLGLLLALTIMGIVMASAIQPNVGVQVQRSKEEEMIYRGEQVARGIARYYGNGNLIGIDLKRRLSYGYLTELKKLRDGITIGVREVKFVRPSAMIDPMTSEEWEPVRARDPRIRKFLQAWQAETQQQPPLSYWELVGTPEKMILADPSGDQGDKKDKPKTNPNDPADPNDPDPSDPDPVDPLAHIFGSSGGGPGFTNAPIIGVAPKRKGKALRTLYGLENYEDWVFIYLPTVNVQSGFRTIP